MPLMSSSTRFPPETRVCYAERFALTYADEELVEVSKARGTVLFGVTVGGSFFYQVQWDHLDLPAMAVPEDILDELDEWVDLGLVGSDAQSAVKVWNQGIDHQLQVISPRSSAMWNGRQLQIRLHPDDFVVFLRRLEDLQAVDEGAHSLLQSMRAAGEE